jgi:hypothetical protein
MIGPVAIYGGDLGPVATIEVNRLGVEIDAFIVCSRRYLDFITIDSGGVVDGRLDG